MAFYISRFKDMDSKEFDVEVVTPMFLGGANTQDAELRVPSIKGMLRFWWRATCGIDSLKKMKEKEAEIFGSTDRKASFSIQIEKPDNTKPVLKNLPQGWRVHVENKEFKIGIIDYLAYGVRDHKKGYTRAHIPSGSSFKLKFFFYDKNQQENILNAFYSFVNHGGLGAKNRNGFGSLYLKNSKKIDFTSIDEMKEYTVQSNKSLLFKNFKMYKKWEDALSEIGLAYRTARLSVEKKRNWNKRLLIGRPIVQTGDSQERHAKPYFLHVNKLDNGNYKGQILFMPYKYLSGHKDYSQDKFKQYQETCEKMNNKLFNISGGSK